jgi:hypothetical protein
MLLNTGPPGGARQEEEGVPWSKRTSAGWDCSSVQALGHELQDSRDLLPRHVELFDASSTLRSSRFSMTVATGRRVP